MNNLNSNTSEYDVSISETSKKKIDITKAYYALKENLKNPDSLKILNVRAKDLNDLIFKYTATNSFGGVVTEPDLFCQIHSKSKR